MARLNTTLQSAGAEHLVIGRLLLEGLQAFRAQANQPGYDVLVVNPSTHQSVKVQVKSRAANDARFFEIGSFDFDFVVFALLNLGKRKSLRAGNPEGRLAPAFYVVPREVIDGQFGSPARVLRTWVLEHEQYLEDWNAIKFALAPSSCPARDS